jgi:predicted transglutaminase-like cysteine proteinase
MSIIRKLEKPFPGPGLGWALMVCLSVTLTIPVVSGAAGRSAGVTSQQRAVAFANLLQELSGASVARQLVRINRFFNALEYRSDTDQWGVPDYWSTPAELMRTGAGDCEDLAIAKYFALRRLGVRAESLRIAYMRDVTHGRAHMVLIYLPPGAGQMLLDSRGDLPLPAEHRRDLAPVYAFNENRVIIGLPGGGERSFPHAGRWVLQHWKSLLERARMAPLDAPSTQGMLAAVAAVR